MANPYVRTACFCSITVFTLTPSHRKVKTGKLSKQPLPASHAHHLCAYHQADAALTQQAIGDALAAKEEWENMPWHDRAAIFLKAADLISGKYRYEIMAATILGQGKNAWQAEIDAAAEVCFFFFRSTLPLCRFKHASAKRRGPPISALPLFPSYFARFLTRSYSSRTSSALE